MAPEQQKTDDPLGKEKVSVVCQTDVVLDVGCMSLLELCEFIFWRQPDFLFLPVPECSFFSS